MKNKIYIGLYATISLVILLRIITAFNFLGEGLNHLISMGIYILIGIYFILASIIYNPSESDKAFLIVSGVTLIGLSFLYNNFSIELLKVVVVIFPLLVIAKLASTARA